jgi:expansin (peptidoglycan-binding protein)
MQWFQWNANGMGSDGWSSVNCGQSMSITNTETGKTVEAYVADECPTCDYGSLDMSPSLFSALNNGNMDAGLVRLFIPYHQLLTPYNSVFPISWHFHRKGN